MNHPIMYSTEFGDLFLIVQGISPSPHFLKRLSLSYMDTKSEQNKKKVSTFRRRKVGSIIITREDGPKTQNLVTIRVGFMWRYSNLLGIKETRHEHLSFIKISKPIHNNYLLSLTNNLWCSPLIIIFSLKCFLLTNFKLLKVLPDNLRKVVFNTKHWFLFNYKC